jgi:hypothetical protein
VKDDDRRGALEIAGSDCSDLEKMEALGLGRLDTGSEPDIFDGFFKDHTIDIRTGELLGRYIAEERDTARLLRSCYEQLKAQAGHAQTNGSANGSGPVADVRMETIEAKLDALCRSVDELRQSRAAVPNSMKAGAAA